MSILALDPTKPDGDRYIGLTGAVINIITEAQQVNVELDSQTFAYTGKEHYFGDVEPAENAAKQVFIVLVIRPERFYTFG